MLKLMDKKIITILRSTRALLFFLLVHIFSDFSQIQRRLKCALKQMLFFFIEVDLDIVKRASSREKLPRGFRPGHTKIVSEYDQEIPITNRRQP